MSETKAPLSLDLENIDIDLQTEETSNYALGTYGLEMYAYQSAVLKEKVDGIAVEISQRQDKIKLLHQILQAINKLSDENGLDISKHPEVVTKLKIAKELGIDLDETQLKFTLQERDFLKESLHMSAEDFNNENKLQTQKMQVHIQEADRWLMLANTLVKTDERINKRMVEKQR